MIFVYFGLLFVEWLALVALFVPFGALVLAESAGAGRIWRRKGVTGKVPPDKRMTWWHVAAAILLLGSTLTVLTSLACEGVRVFSCSNGKWVLPLAETSLWIWTLSALYGPMYAVRLSQQNVRAAVFIGLGVCLLPSTFWWTPAIGIDFEPAISTAFAVAGAVLFLLGLTVKITRVKTAILALACVIMLLALAEVSGPWNPLWVLAAFAMGYAVFRAESRHESTMSFPTVEVPAQVASEPSSPMTSGRVLRFDSNRTFAFIVVNAACILALWLIWRTWFGADESIAAVFALVGLATATAGALLTTLVPMVFGQTRLDVDYAIAAFFAVFVAAVAMHLIGAPLVAVEGDLGVEAGWKPALIAFASLGAFGIAVTTFTGKVRQIRPFMVAMVLPAAFMLPSDALFDFQREYATIVWVQRLSETAITVTLLAIMWYVFGPGRRRKSEQTEAVANPSPPLVSSP